MTTLASIKPKIIRDDLAPGVVPDSTPEVAVREYLLSKCEERLSKKTPEWDVPPLNPATELVAARRDLEDANTELKEKWVEAKANREKLDKQWEELREKEESLKHSFIQFNKFVKENREKRLRTEKKIEEEKELQKSRDAAIQELIEKVEEFNMVKDIMEEHVNKYSMYEKFLLDVAHEFKDFPTVFDVLKRYEALNAARIELTARQERTLVALEKANSDMNKLTEEKTQVIMGLNNQLGELQSRYDKTKAEALRWEIALSHIKNTAAEKALELERVRISCWTMYQNICKRKNVPPTVDQQDVEEQLVTIKRTIKELKKIVPIARRRAAKELIDTI